MTRLFLRITYIYFLWIILFANLFMAFDMMEIVNSFGNTYSSYDWSERYFGVSTLIQALQNIDSTPLGRFSSSVGEFSNRLFKTANSLFYNDWPSFSADEIKNIGDFFRVIGTYLFNIMQMLVSAFTWFVGISVQMIYLTIMIFNIFYQFLWLISGAYSSKLPYDWYGLRDSLLAIKCLIV